MGRAAKPAVIALATCVQALAHEAFPTRPWAQLVARLTPAEREALGGGDNRQLSSRISGQFGAKSPCGPNAATIKAVLTHCMPCLPLQDRLTRYAEIDRRFRAVHGHDATLRGSAVPQQRRATASARQLRDENAVLSVRVAELEQELEATRTRMTALEAELAAVALVGASRAVGVLPALTDPPAQPALVRPYTYAQDTGVTGNSRAGRARDAALDELNAGRTGHAYLIANTPRTFRPLPQYRADLQNTAPLVSLRVPSRVVGRAKVPPWCRQVPPPFVVDT
uniref:hypothetical protein n=1 Tax=Actinoplanes sp. CA-151224 TaxID=3239904 RepID=UPI003F49465E